MSLQYEELQDFYLETALGVCWDVFPDQQGKEIMTSRWEKGLMVPFQQDDWLLFSSTMDEWADFG